MAVENDRERGEDREIVSRRGGWPTLLAEKVHGGGGASRRVISRSTVPVRVLILIFTWNNKDDLT